MYEIFLNEKKEIIDDFTKNKTLDEISEKFNFTKVTITRHLKKSLGQEKYNKLIKLNKNEKKLVKQNDFIILTEKEIQLLELFLVTEKPISKIEISKVPPPKS